MRFSGIRLIALALALSACGTKGSLYLPDTPTSGGPAADVSKSDPRGTRQ